MTKYLRLVILLPLLTACGDQHSLERAPVRDDGARCWAADHNMLAVQAALSKESKQLCIARGGIPATKAVAENGFPQWHYFEVYDRCDFPSVPNALTLEKR